MAAAAVRGGSIRGWTLGALPPPPKPGREGPVSVIDFRQNPCGDFNYRPIVDIVADKNSVYRWF